MFVVVVEERRVSTREEREVLSSLYLDSMREEIFSVREAGELLEVKNLAISSEREDCVLASSSLISFLETITAWIIIGFFILFFFAPIVKLIINGT